jgi:Fe-S cluster biogenesis protein NfuA
MIRDRLRRGASRIRRGLKRRLVGEETTLAQETVVSEPIATAKAPVSPLAAAERPEPPPPEAEPVLTDDADTAGRPMTLETVADLFEDMVRPALQSDGGDIDLVKVDDHDVYVRLTGACSSCPSSTITMKMGIERLLVEEFPQFRNLIQVQGPA